MGHQLDGALFLGAVANLIQASAMVASIQPVAERVLPTNFTPYLIPDLVDE